MSTVTPRGVGRNRSSACTDHFKPCLIAMRGAGAPTSLAPAVAPGAVEVLLDEDQLRGLAGAHPPRRSGTSRAEPGQPAEVVVLALPPRRHLGPREPGVGELLEVPRAGVVRDLAAKGLEVLDLEVLERRVDAAADLLGVDHEQPGGRARRDATLGARHGVHERLGTVLHA